MRAIEGVVRDHLPHVVHCSAISVYNYLQHRHRYTGEWSKWRSYYSRHAFDSEDQWRGEQLRLLQLFLADIKVSSPYYRRLMKGIEPAEFSSIEALSGIPVLEKTTLLEKLAEIRTISKEAGVVSKTGGTTGNSLEVVFSSSDWQQRFGFMSFFWGQWGYERFTKAIWLSGKELLSTRDLQKSRVYKDDYINRIRYLSTFHLSGSVFDAYWEALNSYGARYIFGFPSVLVELCAIARAKGVRADTPFEVFFSTSEPIATNERELINEVLGCRVVDQYASAEGAPFITECSAGALHMQPLTGVFEVVDEQGNPASAGELLVTSFTTHGTPLVRYRIGDQVELEDDLTLCACGSSFPRVKMLAGRSRDFLCRADGAKVNSVNISNATKGVQGVLKFQLIQHELTQIEIRLVVSQEYSGKDERRLLANLRERLGDSMRFEIRRVDDIPRAASGKFRVVINKMADSPAADTLSATAEGKR